MDRNLTGTEAREEGNIGLNVLKIYFKAGGGWPVITVLIVLFAIEQVWSGGKMLQFEAGWAVTCAPAPFLIT